MRLKEFSVGNRVESDHLPLYSEWYTIEEVEREELKVEETNEKMLQCWKEKDCRIFAEKSEEIEVSEGNIHEKWGDLRKKIEEIPLKKVKWRKRKVGYKKWWNRECTKKKRKVERCLKKWREGKINKEAVGREKKEQTDVREEERRAECKRASRN